jgi:hypothetical protein
MCKKYSTLWLVFTTLYTNDSYTSSTLSVSLQVQVSNNVKGHVIFENYIGNFMLS